MAHEIKTFLHKKEEYLAVGVWPTVALVEAKAKQNETAKLLVQCIDLRVRPKEAQTREFGGHILSKSLLVNGIPVTSDVVKFIDRAFCVILSFTSSLISVRPTSASSKTATC